MFFVSGTTITTGKENIIKPLGKYNNFINKIDYSVYILYVSDCLSLLIALLTAQNICYLSVSNPSQTVRKYIRHIRVNNVSGRNIEPPCKKWDGLFISSR